MFPYTLSDKGATVFVDGKPKMFAASHGSFHDILAAIEADDENEVRALMDIRGNVALRTLGRVKILDDVILVAGRVVSGRLIERILEMVSKGNQAVDGYIKFLDRLMKNPSQTAIDELYLFIEACDLPITPEGYFLAYKVVGEDYMSMFTGKGASKFDNSIGQEPTMERKDVDPDRNSHCSNGLHFCSYSYLSFYGSSRGHHIMVVQVDPANVVAIPADFKNAKGRTWTYKVIGEIEDWKGEALTPYFTNEYSDEDDDMVDDDMVDDDMVDDDMVDDDMVDENLKVKKDMISHSIDDFGHLDMYIPPGTPEDDVMAYIDDMDLGNQVNTEGTTIQQTNSDVALSTEKKQKLSPAQVHDIKANYHPKFLDGTMTLTAIGKEFDVHRETIARIFRGDIWSHIT